MLAEDGGGVVDDGEVPVEAAEKFFRARSIGHEARDSLLVDGNDDEALVEDVDLLRPLLDEGVRVMLLVLARRELGVEERVEEVNLRRQLFVVRTALVGLDDLLHGVPVQVERQRQLRESVSTSGRT